MSEIKTHLFSFPAFLITLTFLISTLSPVSSSSVNNIQINAEHSRRSLPSGWTSLGCYTDNASSRTLPHKTSVAGQLTVESCINACQASGYPLAGVEFGSECYCGSFFLNGGAPVSSGCTMACAGDSSELCGGSSRLNVYSNTAIVLTIPTFGTWESIGCYSDRTSARTLVNSLSVTGSMTVEKCLAACQAADFSFAGLENRQQCFCGDSFVNGGAPVNTGCDMTCVGNANEICGGSSRLSVYNNTAVPNNTGVSPPPVTLPEYNGWVSQGCWSDNYPVIGQRALSTPLGVSGPFTVESCINACNTHGYSLAGVTAGSKCYCTSAIGQGSVPVTEGCVLPCQGNTAELCGGSFFYNLYVKHTVPPPAFLPSYGTWESLGCYSFVPGEPSSSSGLFGFGFNGLPTVEKCVSACQGRNYPLAAVTFTGCECANSFLSATPSDVGCILPCTGDRTEFCGNYYFFNGYQNKAFNQAGTTTVPITVPGYGYWASLGCYSDSALADGTLIDVTAAVGGAMTVEKCVTTCSAGRTLAGLKNGDTCYCGNNLVAGPVATGCTSLCAGNSTEFCGGPSALDVYNYTRPFV